MVKIEYLCSTETLFKVNYTYPWLINYFLKWSGINHFILKNLSSFMIF